MLFRSTGATLKCSLDGVPMKGVTKFVLRAEVNNLAVLYTRQIVRYKTAVAVDPEIENEQVPE